MTTPNCMDKITTLREMQFAINYWLATKEITPRAASQLIKQHIELISTRGSESVDKELAVFHKHYSNAKAMQTTTRRIPSPIHEVMNEFISNVDTGIKFRETVNPDYNVTNAWIYSQIPQYFLNNPLKGVETKILKTFDDFEIQPNCLYLSVASFVENCTMAGHIKSPIEVRFSAPRYDTKIGDKIKRLLYTLGLSYTKPTKSALKDSIQVFSFFITPNEQDQIAIRESEKNISSLASIVERLSTGKTYHIYLEDTLVSPKGFKTQADVQAFLDEIKDSIVALSSEKNPTSTYLNSTVYLMSVRGKNGAIVPLTKFRFDFAKETAPL